MDHARTLALSLAGVEERAHFGRPDFRAGGRIFMTLPPEGTSAVLKLPTEVQAALLQASPDVYSVESLGGWAKHGSTLVSLAAIDAAEFEDAVRTAWEHVGRGRATRG